MREGKGREDEGREGKERGGEGREGNSTSRLADEMVSGNYR